MACDLTTLLRQQWSGHGDDLALVAGSERSTWAELESRIGAWVATFRARGLKPGARVAIVLDKGLDAMACLFAAIAQRLTYIPLDPKAPAERLHFILEQAQPDWTVTDASGLKAPEPYQSLPGSPEDVAYIIFTSGSEGRPKGVMIQHGALLNFAGWVQAYFPWLAGQKIMNIASLSFDQSVLDYVMLAALRTPLIFAENPKNPLALLGTVEAEQVVAISTVPNTFTFLLDGAGIAGRFQLSSLNTLILGGSPFHVALRDSLARLYPHVRLFNLYGPTEATVYCSARPVGAAEEFESDPLPLGEPVHETSLFLVDAEDQVVTGPGEGELVIEGAQVMKGYYNDPERTSRSMTVSGQPGKRLYRTGDTVRRTPRGELYFVGRRDDQVKVAGYRVSLLEIETVLTGHPQIVEVGVVACRDERIENRLVAFVAGEVSVATLPEYLKDKLPGYMIPQQILARECLPKNTSGKIDKVTLRKQAESLLEAGR